MRKILLSICLAMASLGMHAAKANSLPVMITQPDGTSLTVLLHGDENVNWYTTLDGALLVKEGNAYYVAKVSDNGQLMQTRQLAHSQLMRNTEESNLILSQNHAAFARYAEPRLGQAGYLPTLGESNGLTKKMKIREDSTLFPHVGSPKALVILVEFSDTTFTLPNPKASFNDYLNNDTGNIVNRGNGENRNYKGVRGYFKDISFGQFTPEFDIVGPVKLPSPLSYYGAGNDNTRALLTDACNAVDDSVDFSQYDANGDGNVDLVYVIYAGHSESEAGNNRNDIWPKSGIGNYGTYDGKQIRRYGVNNELNGRETSRNKYINGIGLFCHEFSHTMGLPDVYASTTSFGADKDNFGMEYWDLMDGGEYVSSGRYPTAYTAWEREVMGWMNVDTLTDTTSIKMTNIDRQDSIAHAYKIINGSVRNEALYLQNIQNEGWNRGLSLSYRRDTVRLHGLLAYRVSYASDNVYFTDGPNNGSRPRIVCVPADGRLGSMASYSTDSSPLNYYKDMAGDTYPGTQNVDSIPYYIAYSGDTITKPVLNIKENDGVITFDYLGVKRTVDAITGVKTQRKADNRIYSITGTYLGTDPSRLPKGIYIINKKKVLL